MKHLKQKISLLLLVILILTSCKKTYRDYKDKELDPHIFHQLVETLTEAMVSDIFSPPVASRNYVYPGIAAYEVLIHEHSGYKSLAGQLTDLSPVPKPLEEKEYFFPLAAIKAYLIVGSNLVFSTEFLEAYEREAMARFAKMNIPPIVMDNSLAYAKQVADHILAWSEKDNYLETRTFPVYTIEQEKSKWKPTPPDFMAGIEPHWGKIRPFVIDSATQFVPDRPTTFDLTSNSIFYKELREVYETVNNLTAEQVNIAQFWDCNPYVTHHQGHGMFATKKITPGGHWIGISSICSIKAGFDLMQSIEAYTKTSIVIADAFISCWDEKYRSLLIRPETLINELLDEDWRPLLQTPPFPEYTSGHSVVSGASATMLTSIFGVDFAFHDTTEVAYGLPPRDFLSFYDAADEAAISRLYGGIHYMPAIKNGVIQGKKVGAFVVTNLKTRN